MSKEPDLFGKTFDQQLQVAGDEIEKKNISPNRRISGEVAFEPVLNGVRVTARDSQHRVLWGDLTQLSSEGRGHLLEYAKQGETRRLV